MSEQKLNFKIDTKEKMHVITIREPILSANMTAAYKKMLLPFLDTDNKNVVVNFKNAAEIEKLFAREMISIQELFYSKNASMIFCNFSKDIRQSLEADGLLDETKVTPTESEAWDIVQMEEIEREFL